ncbi:MAG: YceI family protein [Algibacter sp.]|uniref:YceI family protein n=1 Tax=Algibacter sp. TaxID=1872428 RepID=UPI002604BFB7|nr:YceI family protein [Algibacter sp.]MDG1730412.1 YceI family protein [Algibacter sp.]MDG2177675.1 YceI family protein [Algibacter sp.]
MKHFLFFLIYFCSLSLGFSQNVPSIDFVIRNVGIGVDGHFETFNIETDFDATGKLLQINGVIKAASIETGMESRDEHLLKDDYFDVENYENITLVSKTITAKSEAVFNVVATLTIKEKSKEIRITVNREKVDDKYRVTSKFAINRRDFGVGGRSFILSNTVKINVLHFHKL